MQREADATEGHGCSGRTRMQRKDTDAVVEHNENKHERLSTSKPIAADRTEFRDERDERELSV